MKVRPAHVDESLVRLDGWGYQCYQPVGDIIRAQRVGLHGDQVFPTAFRHGYAELVDDIDFPRVTAGVCLAREDWHNEPMLVRPGYSRDIVRYSR